MVAKTDRMPPHMTISAAALFLCALCWSAGLASPVVPSAAAQSAAAGPNEEAPAADSLRREIRKLVSQLDSDQFVVRQQAAERLHRLAVDEPSQRLVAQELHRVWRSSETSFEVRSRIAPLLDEWADPSLTTPEESVSEEEIAQLVDQLDADSYSARLGAVTRLQWLLRRDEWICPIMLRLKHRLADLELSVADRRRVHAIWEKARGEWLLSDPALWRLPDVTPSQIKQWITQLAETKAPDEPDRDHSPARVAERELLDLLCRNEYVPQIKRLLESELARDDVAEQAAALERILDWTRPALVAEYWDTTGNKGVQHLLIGVPSLPPGAERPSHFDRADDQSAHCVSGNSLSPGDWPVGVAFPHPRQARALFHLVNLPTPRRRMAYEYYVQSDSSKRLAELSARTLNQILVEKRPLSDEEIQMLELLDHQAVSRFAGSYFLAIDDRTGPAFRQLQTAGRPSHHAAICAKLARIGTYEAVPGITTAIEKRRFQEPSDDARYHMAWIAVLAIAQRDPWTGVEAWLADLVPRAEPLRIGGEITTAELGATAAVTLLRRRGTGPDAFHLAIAADPLISSLGCQAYYFTDEKGRREVLAWWEAVSRMTSQTPGPRERHSVRR